MYVPGCSLGYYLHGGLSFIPRCLSSIPGNEALMIAHAFRRSVPVGLCHTPVMRLLQLSSMIQKQPVHRLSVGREFKLDASKPCLLCPSVNVLWGGHVLQSSQVGLTKRFGRLTKGNWSSGRSRFSPSVVCSTSSRDLKYAFSCSNARQFCAIPGRTVHGATPSSSGPRAPSVDKGQRLSSDEGPSLESSNATPFRKRKVALWIGYVGTAFKGLQILPGPDAVNTIEYQLERAIYQAGGILDTNHGHLEKIVWSRSSRTDKGVHSLSTVISMKMEIPSSAWVGDPDGLLLADSINVHLPPTIQVFGIVPVTKSFEARRFCCNRTYQYLLPASLLGFSADSSPEAIGQILENFRSILSKFQGRFAFHNYTIRKLYRADVRVKGSWTKQNSRQRTPLPVKVVAGEDELDEDAELPDPPVEVPVVNTKSATASERVRAYWLDVPDLVDKLSASHFRRILDCSCGGLESYGGAQFIRISITGESFMVHQIRKMVATAVAVSKGFLPYDIIPLSLCRHARIVLPLAPSEGLVLAKNSFYPFRQLLAPAYERKFRESDVGVSRLKQLPKLQISRQMADKVDIFWRDVLLPELAPQLVGSLPIWTLWLENLSQGAISEAEIKDVRASYTKWREEGQLKMEAAAEQETGVLQDVILEDMN